MPSKPFYAPFIENQTILCSRCFSQLGEIEKYGCDEKGFWFIASCRGCGQKMRWYRDADGIAKAPENEKKAEEEENAFSFHMENGEIVMKSE